MNIMLGIIQMDGYINICVSEAAIQQVVAIWYCTHEKKIIRVPPFFFGV